jgi:hypothetical protein
MIGFAPEATAVQLTTDAVVTVVNAPIVTETADLQFGQVLRPTTGTNDIRVSAAGVRTLLGAGDAVLLGGTVHAASYTIDAVASGANPIMTTEPRPIPRTVNHVTFT